MGALKGSGSNRTKLAAGLAICFLGLWGCRMRPEALGPEAMDPIGMETVEEWVADLAPSGATRYDLRWTFQTQRGAVRGQAALRVQPPDSLRFDYRAPFGRSGAVFLDDEELVWAEPEEEVSTLLQAIPLFWAALGIPRDPPEGTTIYGLENDGGRRWLYGVGADTLEYYVARTQPFRFLASLRHLDDLLGLVEVNYDEQTSLPTRATLTFPETASVFIMDVTSADTAATHSPDVWKRP